MSRQVMAIAAFGAIMCLAGVCLAADGTVMVRGNDAVDGPAPVSFFGPGPSGMRFGDVGHTASMDGMPMGYGPGCPTCGFGVQGTPCDPCWRGPCMDWKLIGWYSHFGCERHGNCGWGCCY